MLDGHLTASRLSLIALFDKQCRLRPDRIAVAMPGADNWTYADLNKRALAIEGLFIELDLRRGDRVGILSENSPFFFPIAIAAARMGVIVASLNWRMSRQELAHCASLTQPKVTLVSAKMRPLIDGLDATGRVIEIAPALFESQAPKQKQLRNTVDPEDGLFIIYTSGTTGLPKGALISQRALLARLTVFATDYSINGDDTFFVWSPLFHIASVDLGVCTLLMGGKVVVIDGPDIPLICDYLECEPVSNLVFFQGMLDETLEYLRQRRPQVKRLKKFGAMADLHTPRQIAELTALLGVPCSNTFGTTETGLCPASAGVLACGEEPTELAKTESLLCEVALVDENDNPAPDGEPGELIMRGPTLFSGYWNAAEATREAFRGGWYHTGDVFVRLPDGRLRYVDRRKYLIKSGGENIYPAEIERVVLKHPRVLEAAVVRARDPKWGETPVLMISAEEPAPSADELIALCRAELASYKRPSRVVYVPKGTMPRNNTGKILHHKVEEWLREQES
jgi:acyl-CoA synthetase (AMP-forming)/AMP-acid ligase II